MMKKLFISALFLMSLYSCKKDASPDIASFDAVIKSGGEFASFSNSKSLINQTVTSVIVDSGTWTCTNSTWNIVQGNQDFPLYDPNVSVVYPGSLLQGASLNNATPDVVAVKRGPGTVSIDIVNGSGAVFVNLPEVKKSRITQALNDIIYNNNKVMPARFTFQNEIVKTQDEVSLALGLNVSTWGVTAASNLTFAHVAHYNHALVILKQSFFTMSYDIPYTYAELFAPTVKPQDLAVYVNAGNPACYVSDVTYGRVFYLLIESSDSSNTITSAISATYMGQGGSIDASSLSSLHNLNIKMMAIGGSTSSTFSIINASQLSSLTTLLGQSADIKTGVPLSYVVRTVYNNKLVKNKLDLTYTINDCNP
jgi:thiol-activated cytolysin